MGNSRRLVFSGLMVSALILILALGSVACKGGGPVGQPASGEVEVDLETMEQRDARMAWWREARFGLFIHWGLYAVPAGQWKDETHHAEWILTTAQIPVAEYEKFAPQFNPVQFDAAAWVRMAKDAGMRYIVITSKHHDGFSLFDSQVSDYDVIDATPFGRDILRELEEECLKQGIRLCFYHSIMDWHHPDYLPRRGWEERSAEGADFDRYVDYMKGQVKEIVTNYSDIGVLWFDGEWERTWTPERGRNLYDFVRSLDSDIIINNRVGKGRAGMAGTFDPATASGDFGTPEQEIPAMGLGYDWETCMTMNDHWGYNKNDANWKSSERLIRMLVDIASKGGNFLLNVGPTAEGLFPRESIDRLADMGRWMQTNGESIYGTSASLFESLPWGRSTTKSRTLYLHVFDWPADGRLEVPGLLSRSDKAYLLTDDKTELEVSYQPGSALVSLPASAPDAVASVVVLEFSEKPEVINAPRIQADGDIFVTTHEVALGPGVSNARIRYTLDGSEPDEASPEYTAALSLDTGTMVQCAYFQEGRRVSSVVNRSFYMVKPRPSQELPDRVPGLTYAYFEGEWEMLPEFSELSPLRSGTSAAFDIGVQQRPEDFAVRYSGYILVPEDGVYTFFVASDDGSRLWIGDTLVVDNDGLHGSQTESGRIALARGLHPISTGFFQRTGGMDLEVAFRGPGVEHQVVPSAVLFHKQ
ncbi:MAG: alpha-L-fucosidase [Candidatus Aminicenantaceae bacterium]